MLPVEGVVSGAAALAGSIANGTAVMMLLKSGVTTIVLGALLQARDDVAAKRASVLVSCVMLRAEATSYVT